MNRCFLLAGMIALAGFSCSRTVKQAGGIEVIVTTDMQPSEFDRLRLQVSQESAPGVWHQLVDTGNRLVPREVTLPSTASVTAGSAPNQGALIVVTASNGDQELVQRVVQTQAPTDRIAQLTMVLAKVCKLKVDECPAGQSCQPTTGMCGSNVVDPLTLPTYVPGGGQAEDAGQTEDAGAEADLHKPQKLPCPEIGQSQPLGLSNPEYDRTVRDLLGDTSEPSIAALFPEDSMDIGFRRDLAGPNAGPEWTKRMSQYARARDLVVQSTETRINQLLPCDPASLGEGPCADKFISTFGLRAFRRPLTADETSELRSKFDQGRASGDFATGIGNVIGSALMSPHFLQIEAPGVDAGTFAGNPQGFFGELDPYALASRLSYFIYRSMPDQELFDAAAAGKLATTQEIEDQSLRMLANPKAHDAVLDFFAEWLSLDRLTGSKWTPGDTGMTKSPTVAPNFDALKGYMRTETTMFGETVFFGDGLLTTLLEGTKTSLNAPLAEIYGVNGVTGIEFQPVDLDATRAGLLTQASILSLTSNADESSPTHRGFFVRTKLLCQDVPPAPPPLHVAPLPPTTPGQSNRLRYQQAYADPTCSPCHKLLDGIGNGFEGYDAVGRYRTSENGVPVDTQGTLIELNGGSEVMFNGAVELSRQLALSDEVRNCVARQWFRFALARKESAEDVCSLSGTQEAFQGGRLQDLVLAIATSPSFRFVRWP